MARMSLEYAVNLLAVPQTNTAGMDSVSTRRGSKLTAGGMKNVSQEVAVVLPG